MLSSLVALIVAILPIVYDSSGLILRKLSNMALRGLFLLVLAISRVPSVSVAALGGVAAKRCCK